MQNIMKCPVYVFTNEHYRIGQYSNIKAILFTHYKSCDTERPRFSSYNSHKHWLATVTVNRDWRIVGWRKIEVFLRLFWLNSVITLHGTEFVTKATEQRMTRIRWWRRLVLNWWNRTCLDIRGITYTAYTEKQWCRDLCEGVEFTLISTRPRLSL
jgi:hypothetical protein